MKSSIVLLPIAAGRKYLFHVCRYLSHFPMCIRPFDTILRFDFQYLRSSEDKWSESCQNISNLSRYSLGGEKVPKKYMQFSKLRLLNAQTLSLISLFCSSLISTKCKLTFLYASDDRLRQPPEPTIRISCPS